MKALTHVYIKFVIDLTCNIFPMPFIGKPKLSISSNDIHSLVLWSMIQFMIPSLVTYSYQKSFLSEGNIIKEELC